jgi:Tol biopolymer transport system component
MSVFKHPRLLVIVALLAGLAVLGCGSSAGGSDAPSWTLRLPDGAQNGAWSPDGKVFAIPAHDRIELIRTDGSIERKIEVPGIDNSGLSCECRLWWSEDGSEIHIVTRPRPRARGGVVTVGADGENLRSRHLDMHISDASWAPQGWPLILEPSPTDEGRPGTERSRLLQLDSLEGDPTVFLRWNGFVVDPSFSPDGEELAFSVLPENPNGSLWIAPSSGGKPRRLVSHLTGPEYAWSPNGRELALGDYLPRQGGGGLFLVSATTGKVRLLTRQRQAEGSPPAWTPDGRWITYAGEDGSVSKIRRDGTGRQRLFQLSEEHAYGLSWSPDGRHLVYSTRPVIPTG